MMSFPLIPPVRTEPLVNLRELDLPEPFKPVSGQPLLAPLIDRVLRNMRVALNFFHVNKELRHRQSLGEAQAA